MTTKISSVNPFTAEGYPSEKLHNPTVGRLDPGTNTKTSSKEKPYAKVFHHHTPPTQKN